MRNKNYPGFNKNLNRQELAFSIYCAHCTKHICDSQWEMENKLCLVCSGVYDKLLMQAGLKPKNNQCQ